MLWIVDVDEFILFMKKRSFFFVGYILYFLNEIFFMVDFFLWFERESEWERESKRFNIFCWFLLFIVVYFKINFEIMKKKGVIILRYVINVLNFVCELKYVVV